MQQSIEQRCVCNETMLISSWIQYFLRIFFILGVKEVGSVQHMANLVSVDLDYPISICQCDSQTIIYFRNMSLQFYNLRCMPCLAHLSSPIRTCKPFLYWDSKFGGNGPGRWGHCLMNQKFWCSLSVARSMANLGRTTKANTRCSRLNLLENQFEGILRSNMLRLAKSNWTYTTGTKIFTW